MVLEEKFMEYSAADVLLDKELKKELSGGGYVLVDESGCFGENIDFSKQSMRQTHIETFGKLYALGGDELFEKIIAKGGTCLTQDRNAAKGMADIEGTEKFFLKANASAVSAFSSILSGIMIWAEENDVVNDIKLIPQSETEAEEEEIDETERPEAKHISIALKNGKSVLYDEDTEKFLSIEIEVDGNKETVSEFYSLEQLKLKFEEFEEEKEIVSGFKYQLCENGKFGYISQYFTQVIPPIYEDILISQMTGFFAASVFAWYKTEGEDWGDDYIIHCSGSVSVYDSEGFLFNDELLPEENSNIGCEIKAYGDDWIPQNTAHISGLGCFMPQLDKKMIYYSPSAESKNAIVILPDEDYRRITFSYSDGFLTDGRMSRPAQSLNALACRNFLEDDETEIKPEIFVKKSFLNNVYVAKNKDGYYGVCEINANGKIQSYNLITPFAFTEISVLHKTENDEIYMLADRFGKKGVFTWESFGNRAKYIIPCEYETISCDNVSTITPFEVRKEECFVVSKAGFSGKINMEGEWIEHLKRD